MELHSSVSNSVRRRLSSFDNVQELKQELERRSRLCETLDTRLKDLEKEHTREKEASKAKMRECKHVIEGLTERVRALKREVVSLREGADFSRSAANKSCLSLEQA